MWSAYLILTSLLTVIQHNNTRRISDNKSEWAIDEVIDDIISTRAGDNQKLIK